MNIGPQTRITINRDTTFFCVWCNERSEASKSNATTCSSKCRTRCARFRKLTGFDPEEPPGNVTVRTAYLWLVEKLLTLERARRSHKQQLAMTPPHQRDRMEQCLDEELANKQKMLLG